ncbi:Aromatic-L-amino-acid decarboxylase [Trachymyrmex cornetzi]|uniref:Aromatic-L-amino-acid decarboxylase n=1 Tax=Trachymyrmex cornetzi TaxID=471704 RepID=A0A195DG36_9HYME|nr:Aromatic-L-amino-acid decarboxylase [Trachymyrmex cornetzi]
MDTSEFVEFAKATIDYVADYTNTVRSRNVLPDVEPGYLSKLLPKEAPQKSEKWQEVLKDVEKYIMPGVTHWTSPYFHAYFPSGNSFPSLVADIVSSAIGCIAQSNSSVEKAGILGSMLMRLLPVDDKCSLRGETLKKAMQEDMEKGLIPCYVVATLGTTSTCAFDNMDEIGLICKEYDMWLHIDAAYAGAAFICPEFRYLMSGIQYVDSFNVNVHKWMLVNFDASVMWVKDSRRLEETFSVNRIYLSHDKEGLLPDYRHWQVPLGRRFRSLKLWFVMRIYGVQGLQEYIRNNIKLAHCFETYIRSDDRFEITTEVILGLVCFRIKGDNSLTKELLDRLQAKKKVFLVAGTYHDKLIARFVICSRLCREEDIAISWNEIRSITTEILQTKPILNKESIKNGIKSTDDIATRIESLNLESKKNMQKIS